jgi:hypothetical protein
LARAAALSGIDVNGRLRPNPNWALLPNKFDGSGCYARWWEEVATRAASRPASIVEILWMLRTNLREFA